MTESFTPAGHEARGRGHVQRHRTALCHDAHTNKWKPAGPIMNGFIQFTLPGGNERLSHFGSQTSSAGKDENSVVFDKKRQPEFEALRSDVEAAIVQHHAPKPSGAPAAESLADELTKLAALRDRGVLSPQEFEQQKARLLG
ncbi:SHOCT domain-containing protein [Streptomyces sp. NPDC058405]|uniref:SHOCT domain-containing protein n=1 Tax=Streptomyces sp. NPDC058405 TaxID=3346482 RepID=UPI00364C36B1